MVSLDDRLGNTFPKALRLRRKRQYQAVANHGVKSVGSYIVICGLQRRSGLSRLGITVPKRYGSACERNRFKRIVREAFRTGHRQLAPGFEINVMPRSKAAAAQPCDILRELIYLLKNAESRVQKF